MAFKFVAFSCLLALARASVAPAAVAAPLVSARLEEFDPLPQYRYGYNVADSLTGDYKHQTEQRNGDIVQGQYSLVESDGTRRIVDYAADPVNGFNAVVRKEPLLAAAPVIAEPAVVPARIAAAPVAAPVVAKYAAAYTAPVAYAPAAPVAYASPAARFAAAYTAPVAAAYTAPVAAAYPAPVAAAYTAYPAAYPRFAAAYTAPVAAAPVAARLTAAPYPYKYAAAAPIVAV